MDEGKNKSSNGNMKADKHDNKSHEDSLLRNWVEKERG